MEGEGEEGEVETVGKRREESSRGRAAAGTGRVEEATVKDGAAAWVRKWQVGFQQRGRGRRTDAPAQDPARAAIALPLQCEEGGVWRRMRVAAAAPRTGHHRGRLAPSPRSRGKRRRERRG